MLFALFRWCWPSLEGRMYGRARIYIFATLHYKRRAPSWIKLKPEDLQKQVGKLAEKYDALVVDVPQVELVTGIKFLRVLKKEGFAPSFPEVCTSS